MMRRPTHARALACVLAVLFVLLLPPVITRQVAISYARDLVGAVAANDTRALEKLGTTNPAEVEQLAAIFFGPQWLPLSQPVESVAIAAAPTRPLPPTWEVEVRVSGLGRGERQFTRDVRLQVAVGTAGPYIRGIVSRYPAPPAVRGARSEE